MTNIDKIINFLHSNPGHGFCDDCLSKQLKIFPRQQVNQICNRFAHSQRINRMNSKCHACGISKKINEILLKPTKIIKTQNIQNVPQVNTAQSSMISNYGFKEVGKWDLDISLKSGIRFSLTECSGERVIYAFVAANDVKLIGVCENTTTTLKDRMTRYQNLSGAGQNERISNLIKQFLLQKRQVKIFALRPEIKVQYQGVEVDLVKGLENPLIQIEKPEWNIHG